MGASYIIFISIVNPSMYTNICYFDGRFKVTNKCIKRKVQNLVHIKFIASAMFHI